MWRVEGTFRASPKRVFELWHNPEKYNRLRSITDDLRRVEKYPSVDGIDLYDIYFTLKVPFPFKPRDQILQIFADKRDEKRLMQWGRSTTRQDLPPRKGTVRCEVKRMFQA